MYPSVIYSQNKIFNDSAAIISEISSNSPYSDFGPAVIHDTLYFTSLNVKLRNKGKREFYDLFLAGIDQMGNEKSNRQALKEFITRYNDGPVAWCNKTGELFVTQNYINRNIKRKPFGEETIRLKIIIARQVRGKWTKTGEFPYYSDTFSVGHPTITEKGDTLIFSSDMPGGFGQTDLYYSVRKDGNWSKPVNLGPGINTPDKETFSFLTDQSFNGRYLIFSSNRNNGFGGLDLYYAKLPFASNETGHFNKPINTEYDDFALTIPPGAEFGYLTSNRPGTGDDDIYRFTFKRTILPEKPQPKFRELYVLDSKSRKPVPGVKIISCDKKIYEGGINGRISSLVLNENDCLISVNADGYKSSSKILSNPLAGAKVPFSDTIWMNPRFVLKSLNNIYYDLNKWNILPESAKELDKLAEFMIDNPELKVQLNSYTDDRGSLEYNLGLSWRRTRAAMDYLISKGIEPSRISGDNFGEAFLINQCPQPCSPEKFRENRRTEIIIPGILIGEHVKQTSGDDLFPQMKETVFADNKTFSDNNKKSYFVVFASFQNQANADLFSSSLKREGINISTNKDPFSIRIGIRCNSLSLAKKTLALFKEKYKGCWILEL